MLHGCAEQMMLPAMGAWCGSSSTSPWGSGGVLRTRAPLVSEHPQ